MVTQSYIPRSDADKANWLIHFSQQLPVWANALGVIPGEVTGTIADANHFRWMLECLNILKDRANDAVALKNLLRDGPLSTTNVVPITAPTLPTAVGPVPPGIFVRVSKLVARIKAHPSYTEAIGQDLGIIGPEDTFDPNSAKPILSLKVLGGKVVLGWKKDRCTGIEIHVSRTGVAGPFAFLDLDTKPDYDDPTPIPASPQSWTYKAIYRMGDERVGLWSDPCSISVG